MIKLVNLLKEIQVIPFIKNNKDLERYIKTPNGLKELIAVLKPKETVEDAEEFTIFPEQITDIVTDHKRSGHELNDSDYNKNDPEIILSDDWENEYILSVQPIMYKSWDQYNYQIKLGRNTIYVSQL